MKKTVIEMLKKIYADMDIMDEGDTVKVMLWNGDRFDWDALDDLQEEFESMALSYEYAEYYGYFFEFEGFTLVFHYESWDC